jgi:hypothetical protein
MATSAEFVTLPTGDSRPIESVDTQGAFMCPWCGGPVFPKDKAWATRQCANPACLAYPGLSTDYVRAEQARREQRRQEEEDRRRSNEAMRAYFERDKREEAERWAEVRAEAEKRGACVACLYRSQWRYGTPKYVKHRTLDYHAERTGR